VVSLLASFRHHENLARAMDYWRQAPARTRDMPEFFFFQFPMADCPSAQLAPRYHMMRAFFLDGKLKRESIARSGVAQVDAPECGRSEERKSCKKKDPCPSCRSGPR